MKRQDLARTPEPPFLPGLVLKVPLAMLLILPLLLCFIAPTHAKEGRSSKGDKPADPLGYRVYDWKTPKVDEQKATALGIRKLEGEHLTLYTDLLSSPAIDSFPAIFDQAFPQCIATTTFSKKRQLGLSF